MNNIPEDRDSFFLSFFKKLFQFMDRHLKTGKKLEGGRA